MIAPSSLQVRIDNRARLMSAVLSATRWPGVEQARQRHRAHVHARGTARRVAPLRDHPAVNTLQTLLDQGAPLDAIYEYTLCLSWPDMALSSAPGWAPPGWNERLGDFCGQARLEAWWAEEDDVWQRAVEQTRKIVGKADLVRFFEPFAGEIRDQLVLLPNVSYPTDSEIAVRRGGELIGIVPPRIAWGDNEPWPFDDDAGHLFHAALSAYGRLLIGDLLRRNEAALAAAAAQTLPVSDDFRAAHPTWNEQITALFVLGAVALFLEEGVGPQEAKAYVLMENRIHGVAMLPGVISVLKRYRADYEAGRYASFAEYLPSFGKHLRVAKGMASL